MKEVRTGNWVTGGPSDANGTPVKVELWRNGDSVEEFVSRPCHRRLKKVERLTEIPSDVALGLKLLNRDFRTFGKEKNVPILVPHFGLRIGTLTYRGATKEWRKLVGSDGERTPLYPS
jgi:hypothetical protein